MRQRSIRGAIALVMALLLAACGGDTDDASFDAADSSGETSSEATLAVQAEGDEAMEEDAMADADAPAEAAARTGSAVPATDTSAALQPIDTGRKIIFQASIDVGVEDVTAAAGEALQTIEGLGGLLFGQNTTTESSVSSTLVFKVPPEQFQTALARLGGLGEVWAQTVTADDVTDRVVDLQSRIITAEASVERLRGFLAEASELETIAQLERELLQRETDLELLRGQVRTLENQVSLATITIRFIEDLPGPAIDVRQSAYRGHDDGLTCPGGEELTLEQGEELTVCVTVRNVGDVTLADVEIRDDVLDLGIDELTLVDGDAERPFAPGDTLVYAADRRIDETLRTQVRVTAVPVGDDGNPLGLERVNARDELRVIVVEPVGDPGFGDGLDAGVSTLTSIGRVLAVIGGFALPFIWLIPLLWFGARSWRRRRAERAEAATAAFAAAAATRAAATPPPPAPAPTTPTDPGEPTPPPPTT